MGGKKKESQPTIQEVPLKPEQQMANQLFREVQFPWTQEMYGQSKDIFQPLTKQFGGILGEQLRQPLSLPEDVWNNVWQRSRERTVNEFAPVRQQATERAAGSGMLGQGPTEKYFQSLDLAQAKSVEDMSVDLAIQQWNERKTAQQQAIQNAQGFLTGQPAFSISPQVPQYYSQAPQQKTPNFWQGLGSNVSPIYNNYLTSQGYSDVPGMSVEDTMKMLPLLMMG